MSLNEANPFSAQLETAAIRVYELKQHLATLLNKNSFNSNPEELIDLDILIMMNEDMLSKFQEEYYQILKKYTSKELQ